MHTQYGVIKRGVQHSFMAHQIGESRCRQGFHHRELACGPFGNEGAGVVSGKCRVRHHQRGRRIRSRRCARTQKARATARYKGATRDRYVRASAHRMRRTDAASSWNISPLASCNCIEPHQDNIQRAEPDSTRASMVFRTATLSRLATAWPAGSGAFFFWRSATYFLISTRMTQKSSTTSSVCTIASRRITFSTSAEFGI